MGVFFLYPQKAETPWGIPPFDHFPKEPTRYHLFVWGGGHAGRGIVPPEV